MYKYNDIYFYIIYLSYSLDSWSRDLNTYFTLGNCLFG